MVTGKGEVEERMKARIRNREVERAARSEDDGRVWTLVSVPVRFPCLLPQRGHSEVAAAPL